MFSTELGRGANSYLHSVFSTEWEVLPGVLGRRWANSYPSSVFSTGPLVGGRSLGMGCGGGRTPMSIVCSALPSFLLAAIVIYYPAERVVVFGCSADQGFHGGANS